MKQQGFIINPSKYTIERNCTYDDKRIEGMYYKVDDKDLIPIAYIFPSKSLQAIELFLKELREAKKLYDDTVSRVFYKDFPQYR